jgi:hypothetical protein
MIVTVGLRCALVIVRLQERKGGMSAASGWGVGLGVKCRKCNCGNRLWFALSWRRGRTAYAGCTVDAEVANSAVWADHIGCDGLMP